VCTVQKRFIHRLLTQHAWLVADVYLPWRQKLIVPDKPGTACGSVQTVLLGAVRSHVLARPAARQSFSYTLGAAGCGD